ncbi:restriction endonuclease S subunit [Acidovorax sp. CF316]|jgi:type I restriction enzyme S subunit|uniref:restriction endonuclease subunit S n=1 Tax=Acidovorax sp. CF316 TaxID=1144317 RepID=UPI00026BDC22|nr:restriction endonuclease subunit S [Acidovorax sp. CF316]EJE48852.1 restriction endonuclease S subunit [Acidovorax sp. CF316]
MANDWLIRSLGDVLNFANGKTSPERTNDGKYCVFGSNGPIGQSEFKNAPKDTIIVGRVGSYCGSTFFSKLECWVTDNAIRANAKEGSDARFAYYLLQTLNLNERRAGSGQPLLNQSILSSIDVVVPPPEEQRAIAHIIGTLDDKIELNRRANETLEAAALALFKGWFVDFEPVRAKLEGRWQPGQSLPGLPAHLYDLFPDRFVESELGEVPEGWEHIPFGSLLESTIGGDWGKDAPEDDHNQVVSIIRGTDFPDVSSGGIGKVPTRYTSAKKLASRQLQAGDIVLEISGGSPTQPTGRSIFISESTLERFSNAVVCASFCRRFQPKNRGLGALAFMHLQHLYAAGGTWKYQNQSTGIANFQTTRFLESEMVAMPSAVLLNFFAAQAQSLLEKMSSNENLALVKLRDTLLPKVISGELRVHDAERILGA